jgi:polyphosphate kinase
MEPEITVSSQHLLSREVSWLRFNARVLEESANTRHPLLERVKFCAIFSSNLDEFFMIRVAGLKEQVNAQIYERSADGKTPLEQLSSIQEELLPMLARQAHLLNAELLPALRKQHIFFREFRNLKQSQQQEIESYFRQSVFPILTPLAIDSAHPVPQLRALGLNLLVEMHDLDDPEDERLAFVPIPTMLPRFYVFADPTCYDIITLEEIVEEFLRLLFPHMNVQRVTLFRITRNADLDISEDEADDLLKLIERELRKRRLGTIVRLEYNDRMPEDRVKFLQRVFKLEASDLYPIQGLMAVNQFLQLLEIIDRPDLKDEPFTPALHPQIQKASDIFEAIRSKDILLHHPYDSFSPVVNFLQSAAVDPNVLAIKQTLYRTTSRSPILAALKQAAENGKQVTALIELKARFDEEANITWAKELEQAGVNVVYGMIGLKTHCKMALVLRNEQGRICPYVHLSTGNYNEKTALIYTDIGLFTADLDMGADIAELFNLLTGYSRQREWRRILVAPVNMRERLMMLIQACIDNHSTENPSRIRLVMNSLVDPLMIGALYWASQQGVAIDMIIRGICGLRPGEPGLSENVRVYSIVGRFLEHCRICCFEYAGQTHIFSGSADWMPRNLNRRIEVIYPITDHTLKLQLLSILDAMFRDNLQTWQLTKDGTYVRKATDDYSKPFCAQSHFLELSRSKQQYIDTTASQNIGA